MKTRIAIAGIGAVGGYFGGLMAKKYAGSNEVEIIFVARERSVKVIRKNGLKIITPQEEIVVHPDIITDDASSTGIVDFIICTVKSYDLEESLRAFKSCIGPQTVILPLLNGVDSKERIQKLYPSANVWDGCAYIVSRLTEPGVISESGVIHQIHFGSDQASNTKLRELGKILKHAEIETFLSSDILKTIWEKYLFISAIATLTTSLNLNFGQVLHSENHVKTLIDLLNELKSIAVAKGIKISPDIVELTVAKLKKLPSEATSSMHSDFLKGSATEYKSLTLYVVEFGKELSIATPAYFSLLQTLKASGIKPA